MADTRDQDGPDRDAETAKLELPSFPGFGRKRRGKRTQPADDTDPAAQPAPAAPAAPAAESAPPVEPAPTAPAAAPARAADDTPARPAADSTDVAPDTTTAAETGTRADATPGTTPGTPGTAADPEPVPVETQSQDYAEPLMTDDQPTRVDAVLEPSAPPAHAGPTFTPPAAPEPTPAGPAPGERAPDEPGATPVEPQRKAEKKPFALPAVDGRVVAAVTGLLVGLVGCLLTYLALNACDAIRGTETCGGGPGFVVLLVILALMVVLGALALRLWRLAEPRATSFLGVGVLFVVALLLLQDALLSPWMFLVVPVVTALGFVLGHWVTTAFVEKVPEKGPQIDVR